jgi:hypothetical protein
MGTDDSPHPQPDHSTTTAINTTHAHTEFCDSPLDGTNLDSKPGTDAR